MYLGWRAKALGAICIVFLAASVVLKVRGEAGGGKDVNPYALDSKPQQLAVAPVPVAPLDDLARRPSGKLRPPDYAGGPSPESAFPGRILPGFCVLGRNVISDPTGSWSVASPRQITTVCAGEDPNEPGDGLLAVARHNFIYANGTLDLIAVPGAGTLKITSAPLGEAIEQSAQRGLLRFAGSSGAGGILDLSTDTTRSSAGVK